MTTGQATYLVVLAVCTLLSGFVSGSETALIGISKERVHRFAEATRRGRRVHQLLEDPERMLSTLLVANNLLNVLAAAAATALLIQLVGQRWGPWLATGVVTAILLVFGEITPKTLAARHPERFALAVAPTIWQLSRFLAPLAGLFAAITRGLLRLVRVRVGSDSAAVTEEDIRALAELGEQGGSIEEVEREIIDALFDLADRPVREVMTPRGDIVAFSEPVTMATVREAVAETGHSRYPVIGGDLDELRGLLYVKDLLRLPGTPTPAQIRTLLRAPHYVPESATVLDVLEAMRRERFAIGMVLDEHGGVEGLVTTKDLLSELVGELQDEYDPGAPSLEVVDEVTWLADGRLPLEDLAAALGLTLPEGPYSTVAGFFMDRSGVVPDEGDSIVAAGTRLTVVTMDRNRIEKVRVERLPATGTLSP